MGQELTQDDGFTATGLVEVLGSGSFLHDRFTASGLVEVSSSQATLRRNAELLFEADASPAMIEVLGPNNWTFTNEQNAVPVAP